MSAYEERPDQAPDGMCWTPQDMREPTAYEELKAWCEKHLKADVYNIVPESISYHTTIYFNPDMNDNLPCFIFDENGAYIFSDSCTNEEMCEHIQDYEEMCG